MSIEAHREIFFHCTVRVKSRHNFLLPPQLTLNVCLLFVSLFCPFPPLIVLLKLTWTAEKSAEAAAAASGNAPVPLPPRPPGLFKSSPNSQGAGVGSGAQSPMRGAAGGGGGQYGGSQRSSSAVRAQRSLPAVPSSASSVERVHSEDPPQSTFFHNRGMIFNHRVLLKTWPLFPTFSVAFLVQLYYLHSLLFLLFYEKVLIDFFLFRFFALL